MLNPYSDLFLNKLKNIYDIVTNTESRQAEWQTILDLSGHELQEWIEFNNVTCDTIMYLPKFNCYFILTLLSDFIDTTTTLAGVLLFEPEYGVELMFYKPDDILSLL
jgi:hypothetical protein